MPLDALGRTRATMPGTAGRSPAPRGAGNPLKALVAYTRAFRGRCASVLRLSERASWRAWAWGLQFFPTN